MEIGKRGERKEKRLLYVKRQDQKSPRDCNFFGSMRQGEEVNDLTSVKNSANQI